MKTNVILTKKAERQLIKLPKHIVWKFYTWVSFLSEIGLGEVRKHKGFHDERLKGKRNGQRSIRLNLSYRAIYIELDEELKSISVIEVNKHDY